VCVCVRACVRACVRVCVCFVLRKLILLTPVRPFFIDAERCLPDNYLNSSVFVSFDELGRDLL